MRFTLELSWRWHWRMRHYDDIFGANVDGFACSFGPIALWVEWKT